MITDSPIRISLDQIRIASPCKANWETMQGDERRRLCAECDLHVHNIADMTNAEAESFLATSALEIAAGSRVCVRLFKRSDGTILTKNCPIGLAEVRRRAWAGVRRAAALISLCVVGVFVGRRAMAESEAKTNGMFVADSSCRGIKPFSWISTKLGKQKVTYRGQMIMGDMCAPPPPPTFTQHVKDLSGLPINEGVR